MANVIAYASEWAAEARTAGAADYKEAGAAVQARALAEHPTYLGIVTAVVYNDKSDRYVVKFGEGSSAKATTPVAEFLLTNAFRSTRPTVYAHLSDGAIDGVLLLFVIR